MSDHPSAVRGTGTQDRDDRDAWRAPSWPAAPRCLLGAAGRRPLNVRAIRACLLAALLAALASLVVSNLPAQRPGDAVTLTYWNNAVTLLCVSRSGQLTTVLRRQSALADGLAVAPGNQGLVYWEFGWQNRLLFVDGAGVARTIYLLPLGFFRIDTILVDQGGDLLLAHWGSQPGLYRLKTSKELTFEASITTPIAMEEDLLTGDIVVVDTFGRVYRVRRSGAVVAVPAALPAAPRASVSSHLHTDFDDGSMILHYGRYALRLDPGTGRLTTLFAVAQGHHYGLDHDPYGGGFYRVANSPAGTFVERYDPARGRVTPLALLPVASYGDVVSSGSRILTGLSRPARGRIYVVSLCAPGEAGRPYVAAASLGTLNGIRTPAGRRIPLDLDGLLATSLANPLVFENFQGLLGPGGETLLRIHIPWHEALRGLRFFLAGVTYDRQGVRVVSEPLGVSIEP